jgi:hypothetical protein
MFGQFFIVLVLLYHVIANYWMPSFRRFFINDYLTLEFMVSTIFDLMLPGALVVVLGKNSFIQNLEDFSLLSFLWTFSLLVKWICRIITIC